MNKLKVVIASTAESVKKHSPEILVGIGISGMISSTVLAVKATPKALQIIEEKEKEIGKTKLDSIDVVKNCWKYYIPSVVTGAAAITCIVCANRVNYKRNAALATAYALSEQSFKEYREKVTETIGKKKERTVRDEIAKDRIQKDPVTKHQVISTGKGKTLCYDTISGRYFESDIDSIKRSVNELNRRMLTENYITLNEFYWELDIDMIGIGDDLCWTEDSGLIAIDFSVQLTEENTPCIILEYDVVPRYGTRKMQTLL